MKWDVFISHASEDKDAFVRELATALQKQGVKVFYDEFSLKLGDSLRESIDKGLAESRFSIVVLSKHFFEKSWTNRELDGLIARDTSEDGKFLLPIWHGVTLEEVRKYSPPLAGIVSVNSGAGMDIIVGKILEIVQAVRVNEEHSTDQPDSSSQELERLKAEMAVHQEHAEKQFNSILDKLRSPKGDTYKISGQVGAVGPGAISTGNTFNQTVNSKRSKVKNQIQGDRNVVVGGNISGSTIITGDNNKNKK